MILKCCGRSVAFLFPLEIKFKMGKFFRNYAMLLPAALATIKIPGHSKLNSLKAKGNHLTDIFSRNEALKGTNISGNQSVMVQRDISQNDNLEKLAREAQ